MAAAHRRSRYSARHSRRRRRNPAHARTIRFRVGRRNRSTERTHRPVRSCARQARCSGRVFYLLLQPQGACRPADHDHGRGRLLLRRYLPQRPPRTSIVPSQCAFAPPIRPSNSRTSCRVDWCKTSGRVWVTSSSGAATGCSPISSLSSSTMPSNRSTQVVRGSDLLSNTPRQILLQHALQLPRPGYMHLPLLTESGWTQALQIAACGCGRDASAIASLCIGRCAGWDSSRLRSWLMPRRANSGPGRSGRGIPSHCAMCARFDWTRSSDRFGSAARMDYRRHLKRAPPARAVKCRSTVCRPDSRPGVP